MRPAVIVLAPLLLLPFLACTDTPAEPETEATALFKSERPHVPGFYVEASIRCKPDDVVEVITTFGGPSARMECYDSYPDDIRRTWLPVSDTWVHWYMVRWFGGPYCTEIDSIAVSNLKDGRVTVPTDTDSPCYGSLSFDLEWIPVMPLW